MQMRHWIGLAVFAVLFIFSYSVRDSSHQAVIWFGIGVLLYFVFLKVEPAVARIWLCMGGALAGAILVCEGGMSFYPRYREGWDDVGLWMFSTFVLLAAGGAVGWYIVFRYTNPPLAATTHE